MLKVKDITVLKALFSLAELNLKHKHSSDLVNLIKLSSLFFLLTLSCLINRIRVQDLNLNLQTTMIISGKQSMNIELSERVNLLQNASSTVIATFHKFFKESRYWWFTKIKIILDEFNSKNQIKVTAITTLTRKKRERRGTITSLTLTLWILLAHFKKKSRFWSFLLDFCNMSLTQKWQL